MSWADMEFVQNFTPPDFRAENSTPSISPNFNSLSKKKNTKNEWKWRNLHRWQKFYTAAGSDGIDKFHLWPSPSIGSSYCLVGEIALFWKVLSLQSGSWLFSKKLLNAVNGPMASFSIWKLSKADSSTLRVHFSARPTLLQWTSHSTIFTKNWYTQSTGLSYVQNMLKA